jgi:UDP-glucose 4-epimerase
LAYHASYGIPVIVTRFFNIVGPRQSARYGMVLPAFVRSALAGDPIRVFGDGAQTRNFTYVDDCIDALMRLLENPASNGKVFNIGGNEEVSMQTLAERVRTAAESSSLIEMVSYQEAYPEGSFEDMRRRVPCICHIRGLTGWAPTTSLNAIIRKTIEHERNRREYKPLPCPPSVVHQDLALEAR